MALGVAAQLRLGRGHLMKWPWPLRHTLGLATGHLTNLPLASLHGAASDGAEPASRLSAANANTIVFILSSLGTWEPRKNKRGDPDCRCPQHYNGEWPVAASDGELAR